MEIGRRIGTALGGGDIVALIGELGSGKTCLTQGMAKGLGVAENVPVVSPTFTLVNEYPGRIPLVHLDVYRLLGPRDLEDMGYELAMRQSAPARPTYNEFDEFVMEYDIGDAVRSAQFGVGEIVDIDGLAVTVEFASGVSKKLNVEYARLEKL